MILRRAPTTGRLIAAIPTNKSQLANVSSHNWPCPRSRTLTQWVRRDPISNPCWTSAGNATAHATPKPKPPVIVVEMHATTVPGATGAVGNPAAMATNATIRADQCASPRPKKRWSQRRSQSKSASAFGAAPRAVHATGRQRRHNRPATGPELHGTGFRPSDSLLLLLQPMSCCGRAGTFFNKRTGGRHGPGGSDSGPGKRSLGPTMTPKEGYACRRMAAEPGHAQPARRLGAQPGPDGPSMILEKPGLPAPGTYAPEHTSRSTRVLRSIQAGSAADSQAYQYRPRARVFIGA